MVRLAGSPQGKEMEGYAYILTHPGTPTVFWDHAVCPEWAHLYGPIANLIEVRRRFGIRSDSALCILRAETGLYAACVGNTLMVKLGPAAWQPPPAEWGGGKAGIGGAWRWELAESGCNWAVWALSTVVSGVGESSVAFVGESSVWQPHTPRQQHKQARCTY